jgi:hypothetical protein
MNDDIEKKAIESAGLALWQAYCEKKEELEEALYLIERLENEIVTLKLELDLGAARARAGPGYRLTQRR